MSLRDEVINSIIKTEGGYVNDPRDSGGETNYGITAAVARKWGYTGPMRNLPREIAFEIYADRYWNPLELDEIEKLAPRVAEELADTGVNMGIGRAAEFLQRSLNVLNREQKDYGDIAVDSAIGPATLEALRAFLSRRKSEGEDVLVKMLNSLQGAFYVALAERRSKDEAFVFGWFRTRVGMPLNAPFRDSIDYVKPECPKCPECPEAQSPSSFIVETIKNIIKGLIR